MPTLDDYAAVYLGATEVARAHLGATEVWSADTPPSHVASTVTARSTTQGSVTVAAPAAAEAGDLLIVFWWRNHVSDVSVPEGWVHRGSVTSDGDLKLHAATRPMESGDTSWSWPLVLVGDAIVAVRDGVLGDVNVGSGATSLADSNGVAVVGSAMHWDASGVTFTPSEGTAQQHTASGSLSNWRYTAATHKSGDFAGLSFSASSGSAHNPTVHIAVEVEPV